MRLKLFASVVPATVALVWFTLPAAGQAPARSVDWRSYAGDAGSTRYSPLDQITRDNVKDLRIAWRWKADNFGPRPDFNFEVTPLVVGGTLYTTAGSRRDVVAINPVNGETLWFFRYDEGMRGRIAPRPNSGRGVAYWTDGRGDERIVYITPGYHLIALNAKTGRPVPGFGTDGVVDLYEDFDQPVPKDGAIGSSSPPLIVKDVVIAGAALVSGTAPPAKENAIGYVRGFDVRTGKRRWIFHTIPQPGEFGNDTWERDSWAYTGNTAVWAPMSADEDLGYVYLPVETPTGDYYGGHRPGNNLFAESLVCLDATTGRRVWFYQLIHHGIWDWDIPTAPTLVDITVDGRRIRAVAQVTKQAFTYVFDRTNGQPVWPIVERPVPQSDVPGEKTSPTQPFPTKPPAFDRQGVTLDDLNDLTPALKAEAVRIAADYKLGPIFLPPIVAGSNGLKGVLTLPLNNGGANWPGAAADPETGLLYVGSMTTLLPRSLSHVPERSAMDYISADGGEGGGGAAAGPDGGPPAPRVFGPQGLPMVKPPWGRITAIDLNKGDIAWSVPNGDTPDWVKQHPALKGVNVPPTGNTEHAGLLVTKTLLFAGEGAGLFATPQGSGGPMFRAYDKRTGEAVWSFRLPANQTGHPMSYMVDGHQFIVVAVGARGIPAELVALALP